MWYNFRMEHNISSASKSLFLLAWKLLLSASILQKSQEKNFATTQLFFTSTLKHKLFQHETRNDTFSPYFSWKAEIQSSTRFR